MCAQGAFRPECALGAHRHPARSRRSAVVRAGSAGERLLGLQAGDGVEVAQDRGELLGGPRLAAVAAPVAVGGEAEACRRPGPPRWRGDPADGCRWQAQPWAHRPRPQPEMTTVRPSSRTLPTWKTDGLRLLVTESSPRQFRWTSGTMCTMIELDEVSAGIDVI